MAHRFIDVVTPRPPLRACDVVATLGHFAIVTYAVDPARVRPHVDPRFELDSFDSASGRKVWVSMVPFEDADFHFHAAPFLRFRFGQTNYRTYVIDRQTGERAVWFFGSSLDSWSVLIPRHLWRLPWHRGRIRFDCDYSPEERRYRRYRMTTSSSWAPVELELEDSGREVETLEGPGELEESLVALTHPMKGFYRRRDGHLGSYNIWHDRLRCTAGRIIEGRIGLFDRLGIVPASEQTRPHSVLIQPKTEFAIFLPPRRVAST